jgi:hypothetical protein
MTLRADHVAGAFCIAFGVLVVAVSGELPFGSPSLPGSGFMPTILAALTMLFGAVLVVRGGESRPLADLSWRDAGHAGKVVVLTAAAVFAFVPLGFLLTNLLLIAALLVLVERRGVVGALLFSLGVVVATQMLFVHVLKTPLETGLLGF